MVGADSFASQSSAWSQRAAELGVSSARVVFEYSLTDNCEIGAVRVIENQYEKIFDSNAIATIVRSFVGPFAPSSRDPIQALANSAREIPTPSGLQRMIFWRSELGHRYIACDLNTDGSLAQATLTDGQFRASKSVKDRPIQLRLSTLGTKTRKVTFAFHNGKLNWDDDET